MKTKLPILAIALTSLLAATQVRAQRPIVSPEAVEIIEEASDSGQIDELTVTENIKQRIKEAVSGNALGLNTNSYVGWLGTVGSLTNDSLTISTETSQFLVSITDQTQFIQATKKIDLDELEIGGFVLAIGKLDVNDNMSSVKIQKLDQSPQKQNRSILSGTVLEIDDDLLVIASNLGETTLELDKNSQDLTPAPTATDSAQTTPAPRPGNKIIAIYEPVESKTSDGLTTSYRITSQLETIVEKAD